MSEEEIKNIIYLKNKPISSCKDLHKYFIGRHNEPIIVYLTPKFEIEFENNFYKLECLEQENKKYKEVINGLKDYLKARIEVCDNKLSTPFCNFEKATKERLILSQCLEKLEELEVEHEN